MQRISKELKKLQFSNPGEKMRANSTAARFIWKPMHEAYDVGNQVYACLQAGQRVGWWRGRRQAGCV